MNTKLLRIFLYILSFSLNCVNKNSKEKEIYFLLLFWLLNQNDYTIECVDLASNTTNYSFSNITENCSSVNDGLYSQQWHFTNINLDNIWNSYCGTNTNVVIIDDGLEISHEDLIDNIETGKSYNYKTNTTDTTGDPSNDESIHGTAVAGLIGAKDNNTGIRGVSPRTKLRAYNAVLSGYNSNISDAMSKDIENIWISNNSWGPPDATGLLYPSSDLWKQSVEYGLSKGRKGLGTIYIFAGGNGNLNSGYLADNSNYDGYANFYGAITVCATGDDDKHASYSEKGSNLLLCAPSMGNNNNGIQTTDLMNTYGLNDKYVTLFGSDLTNKNYTRNFNGTSASTPIVSGAVALMLQANPFLTWRDVKYILAKTARKNDPTDSDWTFNAAGYPINHKYGFGILDVKKAVDTAKSWSNLGNYKKCSIWDYKVKRSIVDNGPPLEVLVDTTVFGIQKIEWSSIKLNMNHGYFGDLLVELYSPSGTKAVLAEPHNCFQNGNLSGCNTGQIFWEFGNQRFLDEPANGIFKLLIWDKSTRDDGYLHSLDLTIIGK